MRNKSYTSSKQEIKYSALGPRRYQNQCISIIKIIVQLWTTCKITVTSVYKDINSSTGAIEIFTYNVVHVHDTCKYITYTLLFSYKFLKSNLSFKAYIWTRNNLICFLICVILLKNFQFSNRIQNVSSTAYKITVFANFFLLPF